MARKGKDTDVTVTVKTEEEWNKLIESEVTRPLRCIAKKYICTFLVFHNHIAHNGHDENHHPNETRPLQRNVSFSIFQKYLAQLKRENHYTNQTIENITIRIRLFNRES